MEIANDSHMTSPEKQIALPEELPPPPDLTNIPIRILHSGTVETLIGQNDDLMARLKVSLRRNGILEGQIIETEKLNKDLLCANASLEAQIQVVHEKDSILREKNHRAEHSQTAMTAQIDGLSTEIGKLKAANRNLAAADRYKRRVQKWVRPLLESFKEKQEALKNAGFGKDALLSDAKALLNEKDEHIRSLERQFVRDQAKLVEQYEKAQKNLARNLEKLVLEQKPLLDKAAMVEQATKNEALSQNKIILLERQIQELQGLRDQYRKEAKTLAAEAQCGKKEAQNLGDEVNQLKDELVRTKDQFESLQAVWADTQKRLENSKLQQDSLNRLNQELSRQLTERLPSKALLSKDCEM